METKLRVARSQLGAALYLFLRDKDSIAVHVLACGGAEVVDSLANHNGFSTISSHVLNTYPDLKTDEFYKLRNKHWNAFKHFYKKDNQTPRDDEQLIEKFSDSANDHVLFVGWSDYQSITKKIPIEVQVFQAWWFATNEVRLAPGVDPTIIRQLFPQIMEADRAEQKRRLCRTVEKYRKNEAIAADARTELEPLLAKADH